MPNLIDQILLKIQEGNPRGLTMREIQAAVTGHRTSAVTGLVHVLAKQGRLVEGRDGRYKNAKGKTFKTGEAPAKVEAEPALRRDRGTEPEAGSRGTRAEAPRAPASPGRGEVRKERPAPVREARREESVPPPVVDAQPRVSPAGARAKVITGRIMMHREGYGFVTAEQEGFTSDVFVPRMATGGALSGDKVRVTVQRQDAGFDRVRGTVVEVTERARTSLCGFLEQKGRDSFLLVPSDPNMTIHMPIHRSRIGKAKAGDVVEVKILEVPGRPDEIEGEVVAVLGAQGDPALDSRMVILEQGVRDVWPAAVLEEQESVPAEVSPGELVGRLDLRDQPTVTIDGEDARDFDDAVYLEPGEQGWRLWVHVADVSHYVRPGTPIDKEARLRGTSTYLPDRVIPMLPVVLSNGICSLNPEEDRLALTTAIELDPQGRYLSQKLYSTVIRSHARLTYTEVHGACIDRDPKVRRRLGDTVPMLEQMFALSDHMRARRSERGYIDFAIRQTKVICDERGKPTEIKQMELNKAYGLIEQFMVAANEAVSRWMVEGKRDFVFRVHEQPDPAKLSTLARLTRSFGVDPGDLESGDPGQGIAALLGRAEGRPEESMLRVLALRCMKLAEYSPRNRGHFGLGSQAYTHFTSPIRRYPDLIVHRLLKDRLGALPLESHVRRKTIDELAPTLKDLSTLERKAEAAERETSRLKKIHWLKERIGQEFEGTVTGANPDGLFVELEHVLVDGFLPLDRLPRDDWQYDEENLRLVGNRTKSQFRLADKLRVVVESAEVLSRRIQLGLTGLASEGPRAESRRGRGGDRGPPGGGGGGGRSSRGPSAQPKQHNRRPSRAERKAAQHGGQSPAPETAGKGGSVGIVRGGRGAPSHPGKRTPGGSSARRRRRR